MSVDTALTSNTYQMREANGEISLYNKPHQSQFTKYNRQYIEALNKGYVEKIDSIIEKVNLDENIDNKIKNKISALMISLVLDNEDVITLKKSSKIKEITALIPNMTEIQYINDIPFDIDIVENVFKYLLKLLAGQNLTDGSQYGLFTFDNAKDFNEVFSTKVMGYDSGKDLVQEIDIFNKKNKMIRNRLIDFISKKKGSAFDKESEIKLRREYKFDPKSQSYVKREKVISKKVFELLAEKIFVAYDSLYETIK